MRPLQKNWPVLLALVAAGCKQAADASQSAVTATPTPTTQNAGTPAPSPSASESKIHWTGKKAQDESGKAFNVAVPDKFVLQTPKFAPRGETEYKNPAGDDFRFSASPVDEQSSEIQMHLSLMKGNSLDPTFDLGTYTIYESSMDMSGVHQTGGTPIHIPHSSFTGVIVPKSGSGMAYLVVYTSDGKLENAKSVADGACRWIATHN